MKNKHILIVAAHPDDEVLGCGATIARHHHEGDTVHVVILAEGATSRDERREPDKRNSELKALSAAADRARAILGASSLELHDFPDNRMDAVNLLDVIKVIEGALDRFQPEIVYTHHGGDLNIDHRIVHKAVITACRPVPNAPIRTLLFFEIPSSTEWQAPGSAPSFAPSWFVDVSPWLERKIQALEAYQAEMRPWPHPRSLEAVTHLARWRGATIGVQAAEAFVLGRHLIK